MYGIIGNPLEHSWSPSYFSEKFEAMGIMEIYARFELKKIEDFPRLIQQFPSIKGLNVTIPYKSSIIPYLDVLSPEAKKVAAVNCIQFANGKMIGHNTDIIGFEKSLQRFLPSHFSSQALILGTGGAAKAVAYVLNKKNIPYRFVSRSKNIKILSYQDLNDEIIKESHLIINTTPLGMYPDIAFAPQITYEQLSNQHYLFDLIYNPEETQFLKLGKQQGSFIKNGLEMLVEQAEASWEIWQDF